MSRADAAQALQLMRKQVGGDTRALAKRVGCSASSIQTWEFGQEPSRYYKRRLSSVSRELGMFRVAAFWDALPGPNEKAEP